MGDGAPVLLVGESGAAIKVFAILADVKNIYRPDLILHEYYITRLFFSTCYTR